MQVLEQKIYGNVDVKDLLFFLVIILFALLLARIVNRYLRRSMQEKLSRDQLQLITKMVYYGFLGGAVLFSIPLLGQKLSGLVVAGGVVGVVIGFAAQNIVSNFISGVFILIERPLKIGNSVNVAGTVGIVEEIRIMSTIIRTFDGLYVRIPNITVFTGTLTNYVANVVRRVEYVIGIRYSDDAARAIRIIRDIFDREELVLVKPEPDVFVDNLGESSVNIFVRFWAPADEWWDLKMKLLWRLKQALEAEGIQIPFPQRVLWDGEAQEHPGPRGRRRSVSLLPMSKRDG